MPVDAYTIGSPNKPKESGELKRKNAVSFNLVIISDESLCFHL